MSPRLISLRRLAVLFAALIGTVAAVSGGPTAWADGSAPAFTAVSVGSVWTNNSAVYTEPDGGYAQFAFVMSSAATAGIDTVVFTSAADSSDTVSATFGLSDPLDPCTNGTSGTDCTVAVEFPAGSTAGTWAMTEVDLAEPDGSTYQEPITPSMGSGLEVPTVQVVAGQNPIQASDFQLSTHSVDNSATNQTVTLSMQASDTAGTITGVSPTVNGPDCWSNDGDLTWSGDVVSIPITVTTGQQQPCSISNVMVEDSNESMVDYPASASLSISVTAQPGDSISVGSLTYQHSVPPTGGTVPVSFTVLDPSYVQQVTVNASGPTPGCTVSASTSSVDGTMNTKASVDLDMPSTGDTAQGVPSNCHPGLYALSITVTDRTGSYVYGLGGKSLGAPADIAVGNAGSYVALLPRRVLDTRSGAPVASGHTLTLKVTGTPGVPADATALVMNLTVTDAAKAGFVSAYPEGEGNPGTSNIDFRAGQTIPNQVTVPIGSNGGVLLHNGSSGSVALIADVTGYYVPDTTGAAYTGVTPVRALDTRTQSTGAIPKHGTVSLDLCTRSGIPAGSTAAALNVTVTGPSAGGYLTVSPTGQTRPGTSDLNFTSGETIANAVTAGIGSGCSVDVYNGSDGSANVIVDTDGYYLPDTSGQVENGILVTGTPVRLFDTRYDAVSGDSKPRPVPGNSTISAWGLPPSSLGIGSLLLNVTVTAPTANGYVTAYPDAATGSTPNGSGRPGTSTLDFTKGETIANAAVGTVGRNGYVDFYNHAGSTEVIADLFGYFTDGGAVPSTVPSTVTSSVPAAGSNSAVQEVPSSDPLGVAAASAALRSLPVGR